MKTFWLPFLAATAAMAQPDFSKVEIRATKVAGTVYMLEGAGGNIGVSVGDDGIVLVDDQFAPLVPKIEAALKKIAPKPVKFVLNTHWHADHTGGNEAFGRSAPVVAHTNVRKRLAGGERPAPKGALPVVTFDDKLSLHVNGEEIRALHVPNGHTDGDVVVHFTGSNVVHMGDQYFAGRWPYIDLGSGGSVRGYIANVEAIAAKVPADAKVIPGHGPLSTVAELKAWAATLNEAVRLVEAGVKAGKSADQLKKEKVLAKHERYGWEFITTDRFIEIVHAGLSAR